MTDKEMRELDAWIAENVFGWRQIETIVLNSVLQDVGPYWWPPEYGDPLNPNSGATIHTRPPRYSWDAYMFRLIKREIERRGWIWQAAYCLEGGYDFAIFDPDGSVVHSLDGEETEVARILAVEHAETEELAGCLAFKAAVEATDGEDSN